MAELDDIAEKIEFFNAKIKEEPEYKELMTKIRDFYKREYKHHTGKEYRRKR